MSEACKRTYALTTSSSRPPLTYGTYVIFAQLSDFAEFDGSQGQHKGSGYVAFLATLISLMGGGNSGRVKLQELFEKNERWCQDVEDAPKVTEGRIFLVVLVLAAVRGIFIVAEVTEDDNGRA